MQENDLHCVCVSVHVKETVCKDHTRFSKVVTLGGRLWKESGEIIYLTLGTFVLYLDCMSQLVLFLSFQ